MCSSHRTLDQHRELSHSVTTPRAKALRRPFSREIRYLPPHTHTVLHAGCALHDPSRHLKTRRYPTLLSPAAWAGSVAGAPWSAEAAAPAVSAFLRAPVPKPARPPRTGSPRPGVTALAGFPWRPSRGSLIPGTARRRPPSMFSVLSSSTNLARFPSLSLTKPGGRNCCGLSVTAVSTDFFSSFSFMAGRSVLLVDLSNLSSQFPSSSRTSPFTERKRFPGSCGHIRTANLVPLVVWGMSDTRVVV